MSKSLFLLIALSGLAAVSIAGEAGEAIFEAQRCGACHKPDTGQMNPSLKEIAQAYQGKEEQLIKYLRGEAEPSIRPGKAAVMNRPLEKTKGLSDEDRKALTDFMMRYGT
jgi:cytochrome c